MKVLKNDKFNDGDKVRVTEDYKEYKKGDEFIVWIDPNGGWSNEISWAKGVSKGISNKYLELATPLVKYPRIKLTF